MREGDRFRVARLAAIGRFDVIAFKYPKDPSRSFVKRVVGLPGETIRFDDRGDLLVRSGDRWMIARKPREVQDALWLPVHDGRFVDPATPSWKPDDPARWTIARDPAKGQILTAAPGKSACSVELARSTDCGDLRVTATVTPSDGAITLAIVEGGLITAVEIPIGPGKTKLTRGGSTETEVDGSGLAPGTPATIVFAYVDERITLVVGTKEILAWDDPRPAMTSSPSTVRLACGPGGAKFMDVRVDRDIFWTPGFGPHSADGVVLPPDGYFVVGDNVFNSEDSRTWGPVARSLLIGRVTEIWFPFERARAVH